MEQALLPVNPRGPPGGSDVGGRGGVSASLSKSESNTQPLACYSHCAWDLYKGSILGTSFDVSCLRRGEVLLITATA